MDNNSRILGLDYGAKRIGVAISDPLGITAQPVKTIQYKSEKYLWSALDILFKDFQIEIVVLGLPINMNGSLGPSSQKVKCFGEKINNQYAVKVEYWDERLTSYAAKRTFHEIGKSPRHDKGRIDKLAAIFILQGYMDRQTNICRKPRLK